MLLAQTVLLSLALGINAREIGERNFWRGGHNGFGGGKSSSSAKAVATAVTSAAAVVSSSAVDTTAVAAASSAIVVSSSIDTAVAAASTTTSSSGNSVGAGDGSSTSTTADESDSGAILLAANIQNASDSTGSANAEAGQSNSATDPDNFINFCTGKTITNGLQITAGSCNGVVMGDIPASTNMISTIITNPAPGDTVPANTNFTVNLQVLNLEAGSFTNPDTTYYAAPQALKNGNIVGHTHITIQSLGDSITTSTPPDPAVFAFFKGVNDDGNGQGGLNATVAGGLAAGAYRVCTMTSASNHQPVLMPVAQRGAQDDCTKFVVTDGGAASAGTGGAASAGTGDDTSASSSTVAAAAATSSTAVVGTGSNSTVSTGSTTGGNTNSSGGNTNSSGGNTNSNGGNANSNGGNSNSNFNHHGGRRARYGRFAAREFVA